MTYDVTSKRLRRTMLGECYDGTNDFPWIKANKPYGGSLDVFEVAEIADWQNEEENTPFDVIDETIYGQDFGKDLEAKIRWVSENFDITEEFLKDDAS